MARKCPLCGSGKWKKDRVTGNAVCEDGHVLQDYRSELHVIDGGVNFALIKRRTTKGPRRNKRKEDGRRNKEFYHGAEAEYLKLQAFQLLLRHQVAALQKLWEIPDAYGMVVRDLWAYQLAISTLPDITGLGLEKGEKGPTAQVIPPSSLPELQMGGTYESKLKSDIDLEDFVGESESDISDHIVDPDLLAQLSESEREEDVDEARYEVNQRIDARWKRKRRLRASDTITTLVIGLWIMRLPVIGIDIEKLINDSKIPFIDFGHTTFIPREMNRRMNRDVVLALSPKRSPTPFKIHDSCRIFARLLRQHFKVEIPISNVQPISWRIVSSLGGNPTIHSLTLRLLQLLKCNFHLAARETVTVTKRGSSSRTKAKVQSTATSKNVAEGDDNEEEFDMEDDDELSETGEVIGKDETKYLTFERAKVMHDELPPEVSIASAWIVVMKIIYGLDGRERKAILSADLAIGLPAIEPWLKELRSRLNEGVLRGRETGPRKLEFSIMPDRDIDAFLDKCETILLSNRPAINDANPFPLPHFEPQTTDPLIPTNTWAAYHSSLSTVPRTALPPATQSSKVPLPFMTGESIRSYDPNDRMGKLPEAYGTVLNSAAQVVGWDVTELGKAVKIFETRMKKMKKDVVKKKERLSIKRKLERRARWRQVNGIRSSSRARSQSRSGTRSATGSRAPSRARSRNRGNGRDITAASRANSNVSASRPTLSKSQPVSKAASPRGNSRHAPSSPGGG